MWLCSWSMYRARTERRREPSQHGGKREVHQFKFSGAQPWIIKTAAACCMLNILPTSLLVHTSLITYSAEHFLKFIEVNAFRFWKCNGHSFLSKCVSLLEAISVPPNHLYTRQSLFPFQCRGMPSRKGNTPRSTFGYGLFQWQECCVNKQSWTLNYLKLNANIVKLDAKPNFYVNWGLQMQWYACRLM